MQTSAGARNSLPQSSQKEIGPGESTGPGKLLLNFRRLGAERRRITQTLKELPHPQVLFTFGLLNLNPAPSIDSM
jgi:hypothetical protein